MMAITSRLDVLRRFGVFPRRAICGEILDAVGRTLKTKRNRGERDWRYRRRLVAVLRGDVILNEFTGTWEMQT